MDLTKINYKDFFSKYLQLKEKISVDEYRAFCPFHDDTNKPNLSVNVTKGLYFCHRCSHGGNIVDFYKEKTGKTAENFASEYNIPFVKEEEYEKFLGKLRKTDIEYLIVERGLDHETIKDMGLGYDGRRITIPIYNKHGIIINIRKYDKNSDNKMMSHKKGMGSVQIFGLDSLLKNDKLVFCEGEWDRMVLERNGIRAFTVTGGAGIFKEEWIDQYDIKNKEIYVIFDCDIAGRNGAQKVTEKLIKHNKVKVVDLELKNKDDITDWFVMHGKTAEDLVKKISETEFYVKKELKDEHKEVDLYTASLESYYNKNIAIKSIVAAGEKPQPLELVSETPNAPPVTILIPSRPINRSASAFIAIAEPT